MQRYPCPKCRARLEIQRTFNGKFLASCKRCKLEELLDGSGNIDEAVLDLACRLDTKTAKSTKAGLEHTSMVHEGMIRDRAQIKSMIGKNKIDRLTRQILYSKRDYLSYYTRIKRPAPKMGSDIQDLGLDKRISNHLEKSGIYKLYQFQQDAIREISHGNSVIIEAPTASGKTEAFVIPVIQDILQEPAGRVSALFVYPTKSLARDQSPKIDALAKTVGIRSAVFDGDTGQLARQKILDNPPQILVTNFDVLHYHMWHKTRFSSLLTRVRFLVVDETHVYSGIFGSNVHYIIKRLGRIARSNGRQIQFVASSATLDDAKEFCDRLFDTDMTLVRGSGSAGETDFAMLFPSLRTQRALMVDLTKQLTSARHKTLVFNNSHLNSELLAIQARKRGVDIMVHRAGLMANYRRTVEQSFKSGSLDAVSCTPTLELGIDVGDVDGVISSTIPVNRLMQRIGRAARAGQHGYAFLALGNDPISQYYRNHPTDYLEDVEKTYIDPQNPFVEEFQILAMACDRPLLEDEIYQHKDTITRHVQNGNLTIQAGRYTPNLKKVAPLLQDYSIRGIGESVNIFLDSRLVGQRVLPVALEELHKDAVYFLAGTRYRVTDLQYPKSRHAKLERLPADYPYYTRALTDEMPTIETTYESRTVHGIQTAFCRLRIRKSVHGYANIELGQEAAQGIRVQLDKPLEYDFVTKGIVFCAPRPAKEIARADDGDYVEASGYHAAEHVVIEGSNMITGGVSQDLGGISLGTSGMIFVYDGAIGGSGASRVLYDRLEKVLERSMFIVKECGCSSESGCPRCTFSYRCGNNNEFLHKQACLEVFERILSGEQTRLVDFDDCRPLV